jgi:methyl-accepting chemotaxis protein
MQQSLRETIGRISDSASQLASASEELSAVTEDATRGLQQQSQEIEQAATAVNQMTAAVEEVASNAVATSEASAESDRIARQGREQVQATVAAIEALASGVAGNAEEVGQLAQQVHDISKVLEVIGSIAEQTNLLALNAAIEAARAGEAGRGFAVVADEVRALAHRTQASTREIEQMIVAIQGVPNAVQGMQQSDARARSTLDGAHAAGAALEAIAGAIGQINERNLVIASASEQQAQVAREVDRNLTTIRDLAHQSSAGAEQTSAASQPLSRLAVDLPTLVERFSVEGHKQNAPTSRGVVQQIKRSLAFPALEHQGGVGAAEAEAVAHHGVSLASSVLRRIGRSATSGSSSSMLAEPAMKLFSIISRQ